MGHLPPPPHKSSQVNFHWHFRELENDDTDFGEAEVGGDAGMYDVDGVCWVLKRRLRCLVLGVCCDAPRFVIGRGGARAGLKIV